MGHNSFLRSPKMEEQEVPDTIITEFSSESNDFQSEKDMDIMDDLEGILGIEDEENFVEGNIHGYQQLDWDYFMELDQIKVENTSICFQEESQFSIKRENCEVWEEDDEEEKRKCLNLSLNYQEVLDAWSDRGSLWTDDFSLSLASNGYMGKVPVMEEGRSKRKASVLRYREKRQTRLFSKKIRYEVRKLNADKRPRLKGRFVKRGPEKIL